MELGAHDIGPANGGGDALVPADALAKLKASGYSVEYWQARLNEGKPAVAENGEIFAKAAAENRVVLTVDLDFGEIAALSKGRKTSVILFRLHNTRTPHVIDRLARALADCTDALEKGAVVVVEESRQRVRLLPIGQSAE